MKRHQYRNEQGTWCALCGHLIAAAGELKAPDNCRQCGYPDPEQVAAYFCGDDDETEIEASLELNPAEECGRWDNGRLRSTCALAGTEFCDWECPLS